MLLKVTFAVEKTLWKSAQAESGFAERARAWLRGVQRTLPAGPFPQEFVPMVEKLSTSLRLDRDLRDWLEGTQCKTQIMHELLVLHASLTFPTDEAGAALVQRFVYLDDCMKQY